MRGSGRASLVAATVLFVAAATPSAEAAISLTKITDLAFGDLTAGASAGTVRIAPNGNRTRTGGVTLLASTFDNASFTVATPSGNRGYTIILPGSATLTSGGGFTMTVDTFRSNPSGSGTTNAATRTQTLNVGATLQVGANQKPGTYMGTFTVTVNQN
ncbi:MAG: DUF4402 domain-containing protein [Thermoanaerobaculia bacterium]|nr:DUF4402 domain-containing protein [Thermoanaerobaculia bacterium]